MGRRSTFRTTTIGTGCPPQVPDNFNPPEYLLPNNKSCKRLQFHKVKKCPWFDAGKCYMGESCNYAHFAQELRPRPDLSRTRLCAAVAKGDACRFSRCHFAHSYNELQATSAFYKTKICQFWSFGLGCPAGASCRHAHGELELRSVATDCSEGLSRASSLSKSDKIDSNCNSLEIADNAYYHVANGESSIEISTASHSPVISPKKTSWLWQGKTKGPEDLDEFGEISMPLGLITADTEATTNGADFESGPCFPQVEQVGADAKNAMVDMSSWMSAICLSRLCESDPELVGRIVDSLACNRGGHDEQHYLNVREFEWASAWPRPSRDLPGVLEVKSRSEDVTEVWRGLPTWLLAETSDKRLSCPEASEADELIVLPSLSRL